MVHDSEFGWERYDQNKIRCSVFKPAPTNSNWTKVLGETSLPSFSMMWTTKELVMIALQNEPHTRTTLDRRWTYTRLKNRSSPKGGPWRCHTKRLGACDTLKINASVEGKNWGSTKTPRPKIKHENKSSPNFLSNQIEEVRTKHNNNKFRLANFNKIDRGV